MSDSDAPYVPHPPHNRAEDCPLALSAIEQARAEIARLRALVDAYRDRLNAVRGVLTSLLEGP